MRDAFSTKLYGKSCYTNGNQCLTITNLIYCKNIYISFKFWGQHWNSGGSFIMYFIDLGFLFAFLNIWKT